MRRITPRKADFLKYIQDELQLEKLRQLRTKKQQAVERERLAKLGLLDEFGNDTSSNGNNNMTSKEHLGDFHVIQCIHLLFRRTLRKYNKEDVSIYLQYADVCKQLKSWNKLPQVYAEAVQIHPHCTGLWIEAASHEFFHRQSVSTARILLQRALRINKTAKDLWLQSFALEYHYIAKMKGRRAILEGNSGTEEDDLQSTLFAVAKIVYDNAIEAIPDDVSFRLGFLDLCKSFPYTDSMEAHIYKTIRKDFQDQPQAWIARATHILEVQQKQTEKNEEDDDNDNAPQGFTVPPEEDSSSEEESFDDDDSSDDDSSKENSNDEPAKKKQKSKHDTERADTHEDPILATIQKAIKAVLSSQMVLESMQFLWMYWEKVEEIFTDMDMVARTRQNILVFMQEILNGAASHKGSLKSMYSVGVVLEHAEYFVRVDQAEEAVKVVTDFIDESLLERGESDKNVANLTSVWLRLADLTSEVVSVEEACRVLNRALHHTPMSNPDYLKILLELFGAELSVARQSESDTKTSKEMNKEISDIFQKILLLSSSGSTIGENTDTLDDEVGSVTFGIPSVAQACLHFLNYCCDTLGPLTGARKACKAIVLQSKFLDRLDAKGMAMEDIEALVAFFDKSLKTEICNVKSGSDNEGMSQKKGKLHIRQLYKAVISLFNDVPSLATKYQQERNEASLL